MLVLNRTMTPARIHFKHCRDLSSAQQGRCYVPGILKMHSYQLCHDGLSDPSNMEIYECLAPCAFRSSNNRWYDGIRNYRKHDHQQYRKGRYGIPTAAIIALLMPIGCTFGSPLQWMPTPNASPLYAWSLRRGLKRIISQRTTPSGLWLVSSVIC